MIRATVYITLALDLNINVTEKESMANIRESIEAEAGRRLRELKQWESFAVISKQVVRLDFEPKRGGMIQSEADNAR